MTLILKHRPLSLSHVSYHQINYNYYFVGKIYFVYVHLRLFCVRLVRCVLDATGMLPSVDDVYVHCGPSPSTIWGMTIMSQFLPASDSTLFYTFTLVAAVTTKLDSVRRTDRGEKIVLCRVRREKLRFKRVLSVTCVSFEIPSPKGAKCEMGFGFL